METLPAEILSEISRYFCFHCQHPGLFPHANTDEVLNNKKSLARLCRTSKRICSVVQPTLYHYYATGNFPIKPILFDGDGPRYNTERDYLPQFLRTLSRRSDLASHVVTIQLTQEADKRDGSHRSSCMFHANKSPTLIDHHGLRELLDELRPPNDVAIPEAHGSASQWPRYSRLTPLHWLVTLALILTPRLQSLLLVIDYGVQFYLLAESPHLQFPQLRRLGLMSYQLDYAIDEFEALYAAAPNLEIIYASDADGLHKYFTGGSFRQLQGTGGSRLGPGRPQEPAPVQCVKTGRLGVLLVRMVGGQPCNELDRLSGSVVAGLQDAQETLPEWRNGMERTKAVGPLFTAAGIQVAWSMDLLAPHSRTIIPGVMDWSRLVPLPKINT